MRFAKGEEQDRIGSGIYSTPLQSVYMRELKSPMKNMQDLIISILQSVYMRELKSR